jgi:tetratricopeptide (TPR) repeat protein
MSIKARFVLILLATAASWAQTARPHVSVDHYAVEAEVNPATKTLSATVSLRLTPQGSETNAAVFELNNALNISKATDENGSQLNVSRNQQDFTVRVTFPEPLPVGKPRTITLTYGGTLTGTEESPVWGIKFAAIHDDYAYLLYPSRWFPISEYTVGRYTADMKITVPRGFQVLAGGIGNSTFAGDKVVYAFKVIEREFPGSIAVVKGEPLRVNAEGVTASVYFRGPEAEMAGAYGEEIGKIMSYFTSLFGLPPHANLTVVETENGAPNGYAASGILFLSPTGIGRQLNTHLLANQIARQWWGILLSPSSRDHLWLTNGAARYAELLYSEHVNGAGAVEQEVHDTYVEALTVPDTPVIQASRLEDYSPEYWALTGAKGAAVFHMLRFVTGDELFFKLLREFVSKYAWQAVNTGDFRRAAEQITGTNLQYFFIEWIESSGAPEFRLEYTVYRTQKGFRIMGKVAQDMDTFRMPMELKIETEGNPEQKRIEVVGTSSEFSVDTFGKPRSVILDPNGRVLRFSNSMRVAVAIRRGQQFVEIGEFPEALKEYQKALEVDRNSSLAHYRTAEVFFLQGAYQQAANEFREALNGDLEPKWVEVWAHIHLGYIFDITGQRERAVNEYRLAIRTKDNTQGAQEIASKYLNEPYRRKAPSDR